MTAQNLWDKTYLALLRGINVGGKNIIKMADLRSCFETEGFRDVASYIQSGNVIFRFAFHRAQNLDEENRGNAVRGV